MAAALDCGRAATLDGSGDEGARPLRTHPPYMAVAAEGEAPEGLRQDATPLGLLRLLWWVRRMALCMVLVGDP